MVVRREIAVNTQRVEVSDKTGDVAIVYSIPVPLGKMESLTLRAFENGIEHKAFE